MNRLRALLLPFSLLLLLLLPCCTAPDEKPARKTRIVIGLNPSERSENVQRNARVLAAMIERRAGMPVEIFVAQDYSGLVEALRGRKIDFAFFAPVSYVFAERIADARVLLKAERKGHPYYYGCIVVNADSSYRSLEDLRGRSIAWVDPTSASGHIFPKAALVEAGIAPDTFFAQQTFAGGHDAVLLSVLNGTISAGATFANDTDGIDGSWTQLGEGRFRDRIRAIFFSRPIPGDNLATTQFMIDTWPDVVTRVSDAVRTLTDDSTGRKLMADMYHVDAMIPATSADYDPVRNAADLLHLDISGRIGAASPSDSAGRERNEKRIADRQRNERISTIVFALLGAAGIAFLLFQTVRSRRSGIPAPMPRSPGPEPAGDMLVSLRDLVVTYPEINGGTRRALDGISLDIRQGEFIAVIGLSGAGKSTLLRALNRMNEPASGTIHYLGRDVSHIAGAELVALRRRIGFIFQQFNLVRRLTVLQNVLSGRLGFVPVWRSLLGLFPRPDVARAEQALAAVGLGDRGSSRADALSGGQQQRVAIARAIAQQPQLILADEPMASLDPKLSEVVLQMLSTLNRNEGITIVVNLHVLELARRYADRIVALRDGRILFDGTVKDLDERIIEEIYGSGSSHGGTDDRSSEVTT